MTEPSRLDLAAQYIPHCSPWLEVQTAKGSWLCGPDDAKYLDFGSGGLYSLFGHCSAAPNFVLREHLDHFLYPGEPADVASVYVTQYAQELAGFFPDEPHQVLVCSGVAEARQVISRLVDATGGIEIRPISAEHSLTNSGGVVEEARKDGVLVVADETVTGFGRTGRFLAVNHFGWVPDIVLLGPAGAGGLPFAAVVAPQRIFDAVEYLGPVFTSPAVCGAAWSILRTMGEPLFDHVVSMGALLEKGVGELAEQFPDFIVGLSGVGLLCRLHLKTPTASVQFSKRCRRYGLIVGSDLTITPPLTVTSDEITSAVDMMAQVVLEWEDAQ